MQKSSPYYQVFSWTRASLAAGVLIVVLGMLEASNLSIFFGDRDRVGTIDSTTGAITDFPDFGLGGFVNALTFDSNGVLFANVVGTGVGVVNTATGGFSLLASRPPFPAAGCCIESLTFGNGQLFFGGRDRVGTIDSTSGAITAFPDFGLGGFVNALTFDSNGVLFANVVGTGVGVVNTATGGFSLLASRPPFPAAGCCIESLTFGNGQLFFGGRDRVGTIDSTSGAITAFPDFGLGGFVNALTFDSNGVLFANVVGTGVGVVNTATGGFSLLASRPPFPAAGCCIESLTAPPPMADLTISKSDSTDPVAAGTNFTYMITASNSGPSDAQNVAVNDTLPTGVTFASTSGCSEDPAGQPICTLGTIAAGSSAQYTVAVVVASSTFGTVTNTATVTATTPDPDDGNNSIDEDTTVLSPSLVSGAKAVSGDLTSGMVVYTVTLTNSSTADQRDDPASPEFEDVLPQQLNLVEATADSGIATVDIPGKRVIWNGTISAGDTVVITIEAEIVEAFEGQSIVNQGTINFDSDGDGTNDTAAPTDDPATGGGSDPTVFASPKAFGIPTLSEWGIVLLGILLAGMGVRMLKIESQRQ